MNIKLTLFLFCVYFSRRIYFITNKIFIAIFASTPMKRMRFFSNSPTDLKHLVVSARRAHGSGLFLTLGVSCLTRRYLLNCFLTVKKYQILDGSRRDTKILPSVTFQGNIKTSYYWIFCYITKLFVIISNIKHKFILIYFLKFMCHSGCYEVNNSLLYKRHFGKITIK